MMIHPEGPEALAHGACDNTHEAAGAKRAS